MVDIAFGPEPGKRTDRSGTAQAYLHMVRRKRLYSTVLLVLFAALLSTVFHLAEDRNAGGFLNGLPMLGAFPSEVLSEASAHLANLPGLAWHFLPLLIEKLNIAAVATLLGSLDLLSTRTLAPLPAPRSPL